MRIVATIAVRNGEEYILKCIDHLLQNEIEIAIIDHSSQDETYEICKKYLGNGIVYLDRIEYPGYFSLKEQLKEKYKVIEKIKADWVIHQDVDECLVTPDDNLTLKQSIEIQDKRGYNTINFDEFVFLPYDDCISIYESPYYYFFQPFTPRLMRAWKKNTELSAMSTGGHILEGKINLSPFNHTLKHYIFTSQLQAYEKYSSRNFDKKETSIGWHLNRINLKESNMKFPDKSKLKKLENHLVNNLDKSDPWLKHYWEIL